MNKHEDILIDINESFKKQTHRNRTYILSANGVLPLIVPTKRLKDVSLPISETEICYKTNWQTNHLRAIASAYGKSSYFEYYFDDIERILKKEHKYLVDLNQEIINFLIAKIKLKLNITNTQNYLKDYENDYRDVFDKKHLFIDFTTKPYFQCFSNKYPFQHNLSTLDLLFNMGVDSKAYLWQNKTRK